MSKKVEKILEMGYAIEALEDEISGLKDTIAEKHRRIVELIRENDRLTLTYEPYEPSKPPKTQRKGRLKKLIKRLKDRRG